MNRFLIVAMLFLLMPVTAMAAADTISVDLNVSVFQTMPLGIVPFEETSGEIRWTDETPHQIVTRDANLSGRFEVIASDKFDLVLFSRSHANHYVTGRAMRNSDGKIRLECFLMASQTMDTMLSEAYTIQPHELRRAMHDFFDKIVTRLWGERGVASTKLAYVSKVNGVKQVVVSDYDGYHRSQLTRDTTISMMPVWMKGNKGIIYVSFRSYRPRLYQKTFGGSERALFTQFDQTFSPAVNPKTEELLFSVTSDAGTFLYLGNPATGKARRFIQMNSDQTSPAWSPFATDVLFSTNRGGGPQVYAVGKDGSDLRRVTFNGNYNERASWSPEGDRIVYTSMDDGKMNIYTCALDGSDVVQLTSNAGNNQHPSWSPDGKLIAFSSDRSGSYQIYIMRKDGTNVTQITRGGENTSPTWSWYFDEKKQ